MAEKIHDCMISILQLEKTNCFVLKMEHLILLWKMSSDDHNISILPHATIVAPR